MYIHRIETEVHNTIHMRNGINTNQIPGTDSITTDIKHGEFYTKRIVIGKSIFYVIEENVLEILKQWGVNPTYDGDLVIISKRSAYSYGFGDDVYTALIKNQTTIPRYSCNSREIFKAINNLRKQINAERIMIKRDRSDRTAGVNDLPMSLALHAVLLNDVFIGSKILNDYSTYSIDEMLTKNNLFRHIYKIIHPATKIIQEPI